MNAKHNKMHQELWSTKMKNEIYMCKHFEIRELVHPALYETYKDTPWKLWLLFDARILQEADRLRERFGPCTINNWLWGGNLKECGYRGVHCSCGTAISQHRNGRALDLHFKNYSAEEVREVIKKEWANGEYQIITGIEDHVSWNHIDVRNSNYLNVFNP